MPVPKPPMLQGMQPMQDLQEFYQDRPWFGLDFYRPPHDLAAGYVTQADNLYNVGGLFMIRPGKQAQLTTGFSEPVYLIGSFLAGGAQASAELTDGVITEINVTAGGIGYATAPAVTITDPTGSGASVTAVVTDGVVTGFSGLAGGSGYSAPVITIADQAVWILFTTGGKLYKIENGSNTPIEIKTPSGNSLTLNSANVRGVRFGPFFYLIDSSANGSLYRTDLIYAYTVTALSQPTTAPVATAISASALPGFWPSPTGASYDAPPQYTPGAACALATANVSGGVITGIAVNQGGYGYSSSAGSGPIVEVVDNTTGTPGSGAVIGTVSVNSNGQITSIPLTNGGSGYDSPVVRISQPAGQPSNAFGNTWTQADSSHTWLEYGWTFNPAIRLRGTGGGTAQGDIVGTMAAIGAPAFYDTDANSQSGSSVPLQWVRFDAEGDFLASPSTSPLAVQNVQHTDDSGDWATQFALSFYYYQNNVNAGVTISCQPFSDYEATHSLAPAKTFNFQPKNITGTIGSFPACSTVFDFSELAGAEPIKSWQIKISGNPAVVPPSGELNGGLMIAYITGGGVWGNLIENPQGTFSTGQWQAQKMALQTSAGGWIADTLPDAILQSAPLTSLTKDARLTLSFGSGADYTVGSPVSGSLPTGSAAQIAVGSGYLPNTVVSFVGGGGTGAIGLATVTNGQITAVTITKGGSGYTSAPTLVFGQSFVNIENISVPLTGFIENGTVQFDYPAYALELRLLAAGSGQTYQAIPLTIDSSGSFATGDLTQLATDLSCIGSVQIVFIDNPASASGAFSFNIGNLTFAGNLSVGYAPHFWVYTEVDSNEDLSLVNIIESDPSPYSNTLTPTGEFATAQLALPSSPLNRSSDKFYVYRGGGTFSDGLLRLVSAADWSGNDWTMGNQPSQSSPVPTNDAPPGVQLTPINPYTSWGQNDQNNNPASTGFKYFVDNTPDANLVGNPVLVVGKQPAPPGATAIARFQNRLWLATGTGVISSWLLTPGATAGLYFNPTVDPSDPNAPIKGSGYIPIGQGDGDPVVAMAPLGTVLTVWKGLSTYFIEGYDPTNFGCNEYTTFDGQGLVAPRAICTADNVAYVVEQDGVYTFDGSQLTKISDPIGSLLTPVLNEDGGQVSAAVFAGCASAFHGARLYLFAPEAGGNQNTQCFLWDSRFGAWTGRWTGMNVTSAVSIGSNTDDPDLWLGGFDGQLYKFSGNGDTAAAGGSVSPVSFALATRAYARPPEGLSVWMQGRYNLPLGIEDRAWEPFFRRARPTRLWVELNSYSSSGAQSISVTAGTRYEESQLASTYPLTVSGWQRALIKTKPDRGGLGVIVTLTGSTAYNLEVIAAGVTVARGARTG